MAIQPPQHDSANTMPGKRLPERINPDAILEALVEFRFENAELPEVIVGRLLDAPLWAGYFHARLPAADVPQPIREIDPNFRYQPIIELRKNDGSRITKVGGRVISYHISGPYPGWTIFRQEIETVFRQISEKLNSDEFSRIGFRYINVFRPDKHHVIGLNDTTIKITVGEEIVTTSVNLNYMRNIETNHTITVRIATPDLISGSIPPGFSLLCDIDVATRLGVSVKGFDSVMTWIMKAHDLEKGEFFKILRKEITEHLTVNA